MKVLFVHGLMSSPQGNKARYLAERFEARTPAMNTGDFRGCVDQQAAEIAAFQPDVVVGSSFGGAVVLQLLIEGAWRGPTLLLAQAALKLDDEARLPDDLPVLLVHGRGDEVVPVEHSRTLAATSSRAKLLEVDDEHRLIELTRSDALADLVQQAKELWEGGE
ncbi:MAG TPA: hypothetical protein DEA08_39155 [Planctomycetes bacterium]|nr:hypothetical protein [Planctomycetota bacterium]